MIKIGMKTEQRQFDKREFHRDIDVAIIKVMQAASRAMIREMLKHIPVWRGMAQASLSAFARQSGFKGDIPKGKIWKGTKTKAEPYYPTGKGIAQGDAAGDAEFKIEPRKGRGSTYNVSFSTNVPHFQFMDTATPNNPRAPASPWRSIARGREAFRAHLAANIPGSVPKLNKYFKIRRRTVRIDDE
jgi:hypothetical protein